MRWISVVIMTIIISLLSSCRFPADPHQTLSNILNSHSIKVGICLHLNDEKIDRIEKIILENLSKNLTAKIQWITGDQEQLYRQLQKYELDIVACHIQENSPWKKQVAFTLPFFNEHAPHNTMIKYVMAVPNGENAWLKYVDDFILHHKTMEN